MEFLELNIDWLVEKLKALPGERLHRIGIRGFTLISQ
jgi:hypothetical protein